MENHINWFEQLKIDTVHLAMFFRYAQKNAVFMLHTHPWILEDINLFESFSHLQEMMNTSTHDLDQIVQEIYALDDSGILFDKNDLIDEFDYIKENVHLEFDYLTNMENYIMIVINPNINDTAIVEKLMQYQDIDVSCYHQMKTNNEELKRLRKERRDYFE